MNSNETTSTKQSRRSTSIGVILGAALAGFAAYYFDAAPKVMTYIMYLQENAKVKADVAAAAKVKLEGSDPNEVRGPGGLAPFQDPPALDTAKEPGANAEPSSTPAKE